MLEKIVGEMKSKPFTMILILGLWVAVGILWTGRTNVVKADEFAVLKKEVSSIKDSVQRSALETQLRGISTELFQLNQQVTDKQAKNIVVEQIYWDRINSLQNDRDSIRRQLDQLK